MIYIKEPPIFPQMQVPRLRFESNAVSRND